MSLEPSKVIGQYLLQPADTDFLQQLESGQLAPGRFDHFSHLRYAWLTLQLAPLAVAAQRVGANLKRFATQHGVPEKYHHSLTYACVALVEQRMSAQGLASDFEHFLQCNEDLVRQLPQVLAEYYSHQHLNCAHARRTWNPPDLKPLGNASVFHHDHS